MSEIVELASLCDVRTGRKRDLWPQVHAPEAPRPVSTLLHGAFGTINVIKDYDAGIGAEV